MCAVVNNTDGGTGYGFMWYDDRYKAMRQDFYPVCPFTLLWPEEANDGPCTVLFYNGTNRYVYPKALPLNGTGTQGRCCGYKFPVWRPDAYHSANASFGGVLSVNFQLVDYWRFSYTCAWIDPPPASVGGVPRLPAYTVQRDVYLRHGTNLPVRMNETLTSGYSDFFNLRVGPQDQSVFTSLLDEYACPDAEQDPTFLRGCRK